ncbi:TetR/AcrR family transcriptional regulator [Nocardia sp. NPDC020380]|uniref:TetR/AcrR family transcriptional regulator n=1 Tax=Nocardia sp. NPDC020380 TaxID=3364309 RepID=UPI0037A26A49
MARKQLLAAAERCFLTHGMNVKMDQVAREAGVSRPLLYRHFSGRDELIVGVAGEVMDRYVSTLVGELAPVSDVGELITESLVFVSTVVGKDPVLNLLGESAESGIGVAGLLSNSPELLGRITAMYETVFHLLGEHMRPGLEPGDVARYVLSMALALLMKAVPQADDPDAVRRYVRVFVLPAILASPPPAGPVFTPVRDEITYRTPDLGV